VQIGITTSVIQRGRSGVGQYVLSLVRALIPHASQHEISLFVLEEDRGLFDFAASAIRIVPVAEKFRPAVKDIVWHQAQLPGLARKLGLDVVHAPSYRRLIATAPCAKVGTIHDLAPFRLAGKYDWKRMLYGRVVVKQLARRQDAVIAVSDNTAADIRQFFGVKSERLTTVLNGIDHSRFHGTDAAQARRHVAERWGLNGPFFLFVSRLEHPGKNHVRLIGAYERFRDSVKTDVKLVLGGGDWHGAEVVRKRAADSVYSSDILFPGFVPDAELPALYQAAEAMVYPSLFEGFGLPPIEAMACGCPVICSTRGALGEVVGDAATIIDPESESDIARALAGIMENRDARGSQIAAGLTRAARFSWERAAVETLAVYRAAVARRAHGPQVVPAAGQLVS
jgi:glycosyltransferase involved in cell wall biosynthesis